MHDFNRRSAPLRSSLTLALLAVIHAAAAQEAPSQAADPAPQAAAAAAVGDDATNLDKVVVVGSHIQGASTTDALPVMVVGAEQIDAAGAISGDELMRTIPQMGDVLF